MGASLPRGPGGPDAAGALAVGGRADERIVVYERRLNTGGVRSLVDARRRLGIRVHEYQPPDAVIPDLAGRGDAPVREAVAVAAHHAMVGGRAAGGQLWYRARVPRWPVLAIFLGEAVACGPREAPMQDTTPPPSATPDKPAPPPAAAASATAPADGLPDFVRARLTIAANPIEALAHAYPADELAALGVRESRSFTATAPRVWLLVFRFDDQPALLAAQPALEARIGAGDADDNSTPPYYVKSTYTGAWLLVTGFPSHKPVSPEMEAARTAFLSRFAGEE